MVHGGTGNARIDKERLLRDPHYLLQAVSYEFQKVDTYHRGLITSSNFSQALSSLGLRYGQPEVEDILQYCTITDDGYVHYKELLRVVGPEAPRAKQSSLKGTIYPTQEAMMYEPSASASEAGESVRNGFFAGKSDDIRKVFSRWEQGYLSNEDFKETLRGLGFQVTRELESLLVTYGPARSMPFSKLMYALQVDANDGRRARNAHGQHATAGEQANRGAGQGSHWGNLAPEARYHGQSQASQSESASYDITSAEDLSNPQSLRQTICDFVDGHIPAVAFRMQLERFAVPMTSELDKLIRMHECDNSVRFQDLARLMLRKDKIDAERGPISGSATPRSYVGSAAPSVGESHGYAGSHVAGGYAGSHMTGSHLGERSQGGYARNGRSDAGRFAAPRDSAAASVRSNMIPYANGGRWSDDARSAASQSSYTPRAAPKVNAPWAVDEGQRQPLEPPPSRSSSSSLAGHHGDIIGWNGRPHEQERSVQGSRKEMAHIAPPGGSGPNNFLHWEDKTSSRSGDDRAGKRLYGRQAPASMQAPFGRSSDVSQPGTAAPHLFHPFGTYQDMKLRRPEDAGTDEYRAANSVQGPRRLDR